MTGDEVRSLRVGTLARVEGEGGVEVRIGKDRSVRVRLRIFEPPRLFEALLRGRMLWEAPDITARICGICPAAYALTAVQAMEAALGMEIPAEVRDLRRLLYCGEWIQSHVLHACFLHAPDFFHLDDAIALAREHRDWIDQGLSLRRLGNRIMALTGGRPIHPVNVRVGGFYQAPAADAVRALVPALQDGLALAESLARAFGALPFPDASFDYTFVSLAAESRYPIDGGDWIVSNRGLKIPIAQFAEHFAESQVAHSTALHSRMADGSSYLTGPLARFANCADALPPRVQALAEEVGLSRPCLNPFQSILVRMVEVVYAFEEALRLAAHYQPPPPQAVSAPTAATSAAIGHGATEAPRGLLYHRYTLDAGGRIAGAVIVPPTAQNQSRIEDDIRSLVEASLDLGDEALRWRCEQAIRNHDPCISCATHQLHVDLTRA